MLTWVLLGSGLAAWPAAAALQQSRFFWLGLTLLVLTVLVYLFGTRLLRVARLEGDKVWVRGAHPPYLARLPEWKG